MENKAKSSFAFKTLSTTLLKSLFENSELNKCEVMYNIQRKKMESTELQFLFKLFVFSFYFLLFSTNTLGKSMNEYALLCSSISPNTKTFLYGWRKDQLLAISASPPTITYQAVLTIKKCFYTYWQPRQNPPFTRWCPRTLLFFNPMAYFNLHICLYGQCPRL